MRKYYRVDRLVAFFHNFKYKYPRLNKILNKYEYGSQNLKFKGNNLIHAFSNKIMRYFITLRKLYLRNDYMFYSQKTVAARSSNKFDRLVALFRKLSWSRKFHKFNYVRRNRKSFVFLRFSFFSNY
jgi:hypothetical protein